MPLDYIPTACGLFIDWFIVPSPVLEHLGQNCWQRPNNAGNTGFCRTYCMNCFEGDDLYILWSGGEMVVYVWRLLVCIHYDTLIYQYQKLNGLYPLFLLWLSLNWCLRELLHKMAPEQGLSKLYWVKAVCVLTWEIIHLYDKSLYKSVYTPASHFIAWILILKVILSHNFSKWRLTLPRLGVSIS